MGDQPNISNDGYNEALWRIKKCYELGVRDLRLDKLGLRTLPSEFSQLKSLTKLDLGFNEFAEMPAQIGELTQLRTLSLAGNQLSSIPSKIGNLRFLKNLIVSDNQLGKLPREIGRLRALQELDVSGNRIGTLPKEVKQLKRLTKFCLGNNRLHNLPLAIRELKWLERLFLDNNLLTDLPDWVQELSQLKQLALHENPSLGLPAELLGPAPSELRESPADPRVILDYYYSRQVDGEEPMREVRLLLVGRGRVGKTSLLKALRDEEPDPQELETPGISVLPLPLECSQGVATGHVWDFGGQEFLHGTHQIFLAERCVYLLVLGGRESNWETETDYWLRFIQSFGGDSPVVVVLTKYDEHPFSVDRFRLKERCPQIVGFVETDSFTRRGISELTELLTKTIDDMNDVWLGVPKKWHRIKKKLAGMPESFLEYREYQDLCEETGVVDPGRQVSLAKALHRLGIALNFRDHHRLKQTSVLKPQWVTEAIYGLIRYVQIRDCHGVMELPWMADALDAKAYPVDKHSFVLELMEKFEVAFALEGTSRWLIPELLREEQPEAFEEFHGEHVQRLRFTYPDALPPGLLPRFIVRTHEMSADHPELRWRSGVVLQWEGARALVRLNRIERRTEVAVIESQPNDDDRQSLFDLIRAHLTVLHGKVRVVEEAEMEGHLDSWVRVGKLRKLEEKGTRQVDEETRDGQLAKVNVSQTLDGVESRQAREAERSTAPPRMRLFVCYAHDDAKKIGPLSKHLTILGQRGYIQTWKDTQLVAGEEWKDRIMEELVRADIVLLLYSTACRASRFIQETEAPAALNRVKTNDPPCKLIVVPLDRKDWDNSVALERELKTLQAATWNAKPVLKFGRHAHGWLEVEHSIRKAVELSRTTAS